MVQHKIELEPYPKLWLTEISMHKFSSLWSFEKGLLTHNIHQEICEIT